MNLLREIRERHVLQAAGVYVGACWVLIEILDRLVERYLLSPTLTDVFFWGLFSLLPAVILIAYEHGKLGKDKVSRIEIVGVPVNLMATTGLLLTLFSGEYMGSTAEKVMVLNEDGQTVEKYIPKAGFRHSLLLFFWENESGDPHLDWLQYGVAEMLAQDLSQNPYLIPSTAYTHYEWGLSARLERAGYSDALHAPDSLQREIADDMDKQFFVNGDINLAASGYSLTARLYKPNGMELVRQFEVSGPDVLSLIDNLSSALKQTLEVPAGGGRLADDLQVVEQYSPSLVAIEHYINARTLRLLDNNFERAIAELDSALDRDPGFALAGLIKVGFLTDLGRSEEAIQVARSIEPHDYKLIAADKDQLKATVYSLSGNPDKGNAVLKMRVELDPNNAGAYLRLADHYQWSGELQNARLAFEKVLELDPNDSRVLRELSVLYRASGDIGKAIEFALRYSKQRPGDMSAAINLGVLYQDTGERELARQQFERANFLRSGVVTP